jgi:hypothetical protein
MCCTGGPQGTPWIDGEQANACAKGDEHGALRYPASASFRTLPRSGPLHGAMLLNHLSRSNLRQHGIEVQGEAVVQGEHTLYLIMEAADEGCLRDFLQPFKMAGSLDIYAASTCARVVASGGCATAMPVTDVVHAVDPASSLPTIYRSRLAGPSCTSAQR